MGRFSSRAIGHHNALLGMLLAGVAVLTGWAVATGQAALPDRGALGWLLLSGVATMSMTLLLYLGLARGPISVVAPIVSAHPVGVIAVYAVESGTFPPAWALAAMLWTVGGIVIVAMWAEEEADAELAPGPAAASIGMRGCGSGTAALGVTVIIAVCSSLSYAALIVAGQKAASLYGEFLTLWYGRIISLVALLCLFAMRRTRPQVPRAWWPFVGAQGFLDACGYLALFAGSTAGGREIVAVVASTFGAVTVLLARAILKERILPVQWIGLFLVFSGVAVLSSSP